jgi:transposase InsO family protein
VWSRKIVGWTVEVEESAERAQAMLGEAFADEGVRPGQLVVHSDNGAPMKAGTTLAFLQGLGVVPSFSRPSVSNDNPYSESLFRTAKYRPEYPEHFASMEQARAWVTWFVAWYNNEHRHSALKFVTPQQRHAGEDVAILARRTAVYEKARARHPRRWSRAIRDWTPVEEVLLNPAPSATPYATEVA